MACDTALQEDGRGQQLITPPLDGTILPGVTRDSILQLAQHWRDCDVLEGHLTVGALKKVSLQSSACSAVTPLVKIQGQILALVRPGSSAICCVLLKAAYKSWNRQARK